MSTKKPRGRPRRYSEYDQILQDFPAKSMTKRPVYANNVGIFRGKTGDTAYLKVFLRHGGIYKGKSYPRNHCLEVPVGKLGSWDWSSLEAERDRLQGKADRNEPLEDKQAVTFKECAERWLEIAKTRQRSYLTSKYAIENNFIPAFGHKDITDITVRDINEWQAKRLGEVKPATALRDKYVFSGVTGNAANHVWDRIVARANIKDLHFHDLRHEAISRFFEKGLSLPEVALISGHRDFRMLFRYTHLKAEDIAKKL